MCWMCFELEGKLEFPSYLTLILVPHWIEDERFVLAQKPITLVLMMINSFSYSTNDLVFN